MGRYEYLILDLLIIIGPLCSSFDRKVRFVQKWKFGFTAIFLIGMLYIGWDIWAVSRGHWRFNPDYVMETRIFELPIEEILFFLVVPFAALFMWEVLRFYRKGKDDDINFNPLRYAGLLGGVGLILWIGKGYEYTGLTFLASGLFFLLDQVTKTYLTRQVNFWYLQGLIIATTLVFNGFLTARPIVLYGESFQLGLRVFTIPVEDFGFGFSLNALILWLYTWMQSGHKSIQQG
jgi:lycopene cyclase domain-containing protein